MEAATKRKHKSQVIRPGDVVKVINPDFFMRCGYPLCLDDGERMLMEDGSPDREFILDMAKRFGIPIGIEFLGNSSKTDVDFKKILRTLAYWKIKKEGFGGSERKIFTKRFESANGLTFEVERKKIVMTGNRISGSGSSWSYYGEYEYEPPYLEDCKSNIILYLKNQVSQGDNRKFYQSAVDVYSLHDGDRFYDLAIEEKNVEKVFQKNP